MTINLMPQPEPRPVLGISMTALKQPTLEARLAWALEHKIEGIELLATGDPWGFHTPSVAPQERENLREILSGFAQIAVQAPHQGTMDVTLVSPSAAIRRASIAEIWSVCRFTEGILSHRTEEGRGVIIIRSGMAPVGTSTERQEAYLAESLTTLDRVAGDHNAMIGVANYDYFDKFSAFDRLCRSGLKNTGIALDLTHPQLAPADITELLETWGEKIVHLRVPTDSEAKHWSKPLQNIHYQRMICLSEMPDIPPNPSLTTSHWLDAQKLFWQTLFVAGKTTPRALISGNDD